MSCCSITKRKEELKATVSPTQLLWSKPTCNSETPVAFRMGEMGAREGNGVKSQSRVFIIQLGKGTDVGKRGRDEGAGPRATPWHRGRGSARGDATAASAVPQHPFGGKTRGSTKKKRKMENSHHHIPS